MENLVLVLDTSSSMNEKEQKSVRSKMSVLVEQVSTLLMSRKMWKSICIYTFKDKAMFLGKFFDAESACKALHNVSCYGSTSIGDSLLEVIGELKKDSAKNTSIVCVTDGEDYSWQSKYNEITQIVADMPDVTLKVIILGKALSYIDRETETDNEIVSYIDDLEQVKVEIENVMKKPLIEMQPKLTIAPVVIPLVKCDAADLKAVEDALQQTIPFLETLTELRYYPVPTFLVNSYMLQSTGLKEKGVQFDENIKEDIEEICRFLEAVCLTYHCGEFTESWIRDGRPTGSEKCGRDDVPTYDENTRDYGSWLKENNEWREWVRGCSEWVIGGLRKYSDGEDIPDAFAVPKPAADYAKGATNQNERLAGALKVLSTIRTVLNKLSKSEIEELELKNERFSYGRDNPIREVWCRRLKNGKFHKLWASVDQCGNWKRDIVSISSAYSIALNLLIELLPQAKLQSMEYYKVISNLRTFGVYIPPSHVDNKNFQALLKENNFPDYFTPQCGKVLVCLEDCRKAAESCSDAALWPKFLLPILVHEHTHAVVQEGIDEMRKSVQNWTGDADEMTVVSETLAEWSELEFCREDDTLTEIITEHSGSGNLPEWPYAGALLLEKICQKDGIQAYKDFLRNYREGNPITFHQLTQSKV